ncbi:MAG: hypothetical protein U9R37_00885 [Campylobacterota bacterium]|nr:hypothetical protein [Campylobacterota bacterium]
MKKILSVDGNLINSKIIEQDIKVYFESIDEEFEFFCGTKSTKYNGYIK